MGVFENKPNIPKENLFDEDMDKISLKITGFTNRPQSVENKIFGNVGSGGMKMDFGLKSKTMNVDNFLSFNKKSKENNINRFFGNTKKINTIKQPDFNNYFKFNKSKSQNMDKFFTVNKLESDMKVKNRKMEGFLGVNKNNSNTNNKMQMFLETTNQNIGMNNINNKLNSMLGGNMGGKINNVLQNNTANKLNSMLGTGDMSGKINNILGNGINMDMYSRNNIDNVVRKEEVKQKVKTGAKVVGAGIAKGAKYVGKGFKNVAEGIQSLREKKEQRTDLRQVNADIINRRLKEQVLNKIDSGTLTIEDLAVLGLIKNDGIVTTKKEKGKMQQITAGVSDAIGQFGDISGKGTDYIKQLSRDTFGDIGTQSPNNLSRLLYNDRGDYVSRQGGMKRVPIYDKKGNVKMVTVPGSEMEYNPMEAFAKRANILVNTKGSISQDLLGMRQMTPSMSGRDYEKSVLGLLPMSKQEQIMKVQMQQQIAQIPQMPQMQEQMAPAQPRVSVPYVERQVAPPGQTITSPFSGRPVTYTRGPYKKKGLYRLQQTTYETPEGNIVVPNPNLNQPAVIPEQIQPIQVVQTQESDPFNMLQSVDDTSDKEKARAIIGF